MFVGHLAAALAGKRYYAPNVNLGWFMAAAIAVDLIWPIFLLLGVERVIIAPGATAFTPLIFDSYPWTHSLAMGFLWALLLVGIARVARVAGTAWVILGALVLSHWALDAISHAPDMPVWPGDSPKVGLGLWNSIPLTFAVEGAMWLAAIAGYISLRRKQERRVGFVFWSFVVVCTAMWAASPFTAPPPNQQAIAWFGLVGWIVIPWAAWADRGVRAT